MFTAAAGPMAVDAERASGYRYGHRAYLIQLRRRGAGTVLIDPISLPDLTRMGDALKEIEWVLHAASQDLACLAEVGMRPARIFDTELAGRLLGLPRVGLGPLVDSILGYTLEKGYSSADWSTRPLPVDWLRYAALDVELLIELRDALEARLRAAGKLDWAYQEFAAIVAAPRSEPRTDPWRRTSGLHRIRDRRRLAVVRELWYSRDDLARKRDLSPGRVLPDTAIIDAALVMPTTPAALAAMPVYRGRSQRRELARWFDAVSRALAAPDDELPPQTAPYDGPPPPRSWSTRQPDAAARLTSARARVSEIAAAHDVPVENLLAPEILRRAAWAPPDPLTSSTVSQMFRHRGARQWQVDLTAAAVAEAFTEISDSASTS
jgi:ribonuclease D